MSEGGLGKIYLHIMSGFLDSFFSSSNPFMSYFVSVYSLLLGNCIRY